MGGYEMGSSLARDEGVDGAGKLIAGSAVLTPTLVDEWLASQNAKKIMREQGLEPRGLTRALSTYAAPLALGAGTGLYAYNKQDF